MFAFTAKPVVDQFKKKFVEDWVEIQRQFETKKRSINSEKTGKETLNIPMALVETYKERTGKTLEDAVKGNKEFEGKLSCTAGRLRVDCSIMRSWYKESCENLVKHVKNLLAQKSSAGTKTILLVGGFSESPMLQDAIRNNFKDKRLIVPEEAGLAVLKGAVLFGHDPVTITSRIAKCSYGIRVYRDFDQSTHPREKLQMIGGRQKCKDVYAKHVELGQELKVGESQVSQRYTPLEADQLSLVFDIYTANEKNPLFVTDCGCSYVGQLEVDVPEYGKDRGVWVKMTFGGTEVTVEAREEKSGRISKASFDFLQ